MSDEQHPNDAEQDAAAQAPNEAPDPTTGSSANDPVAAAAPPAPRPGRRNREPRTIQLRTLAAYGLAVAVGFVGSAAWHHHQQRQAFAQAGIAAGIPSETTATTAPGAVSEGCTVDTTPDASDVGTPPAAPEAVTAAGQPAPMTPTPCDAPSEAGSTATTIPAPTTTPTAPATTSPRPSPVPAPPRIHRR